MMLGNAHSVPDYRRAKAHWNRAFLRGQGWRELANRQRRRMWRQGLKRLVSSQQVGKDE